MTYEKGGDYSNRWMKNTETGQVVTEWDRVTVGKAKTVWDVSAIDSLMTGGKEGYVELHRQRPTSGPRQRGVVYRVEKMDRLKKVEEE